MKKMHDIIFLKLYLLSRFPLTSDLLFVMTLIIFYYSNSVFQVKNIKFSRGACLKTPTFAGSLDILHYLKNVLGPVFRIKFLLFVMTLIIFYYSNSVFQIKNIKFSRGACLKTPTFDGSRDIFHYLKNVLGPVSRIKFSKTWQVC